MARFEYSRERKSKRDFKDSPSKRGNMGRRNFEDVHKSRKDFRRDSNNYSRNRSDIEMTKVICSSCGKECEVPFKPTSSKPVYCDECFAKKGKFRSDKGPNKDFEIINEKLNKIMKALKIE